GAGERHARPCRGRGSRPALAGVLAWRETIDARVLARLGAGGFEPLARQVLLLGTHHEEQHQELLLTDIKHALWCNPLQPAYAVDPADAPDAAAPVPCAGAASAWLRHDEQVTLIGAPAWPGSEGFAYDNETPRHR